MRIFLSVWFIRIQIFLFIRCLVLCSHIILVDALKLFFNEFFSLRLFYLIIAHWSEAFMLYMRNVGGNKYSTNQNPYFELWIEKQCDAEQKTTTSSSTMYILWIFCFFSYPNSVCNFICLSNWDHYRILVGCQLERILFFWKIPKKNENRNDFFCVSFYISNNNNWQYDFGDRIAGSLNLLLILDVGQLEIKNRNISFILCILATCIVWTFTKIGEQNMKWIERSKTIQIQTKLQSGKLRIGTKGERERCTFANCYSVGTNNCVM